jgi:hypothetical protein
MANRYESEAARRAAFKAYYRHTEERAPFDRPELVEGLLLETFDPSTGHALFPPAESYTRGLFLQAVPWHSDRSVGEDNPVLWREKHRVKDAFLGGHLGAKRTKQDRLSTGAISYQDQREGVGIAWEVYYDIDTPFKFNARPDFWDLAIYKVPLKGESPLAKVQYRPDSIRPLSIQMAVGTISNQARFANPNSGQGPEITLSLTEDQSHFVVFDGRTPVGKRVGEVGVNDSDQRDLPDIPYRFNVFRIPTEEGQGESWSVYRDSRGKGRDWHLEFPILKPNTMDAAIKGDFRAYRDFVNQNRVLFLER